MRKTIKSKKFQKNNSGITSLDFQLVDYFKS